MQAPMTHSILPFAGLVTISIHFYLRDIFINVCLVKTRPMEAELLLVFADHLISEPSTVTGS